MKPNKEAQLKRAVELKGQGFSMQKIAETVVEEFGGEVRKTYDRLWYAMNRSKRREEIGCLIEKIAGLNGVDADSIATIWKQGTDDEGNSYSVKINPDKTKSDISELAKKTIEDMKKYSPKYPKIKRKKTKEGHLLVVDPADIHLGKLCHVFETGDEYNNEIAIQRVKEGVKGIVDKCSGWEIDKVMLVIGNDILHIDSPKKTTTAGTPQDTDGMWHTNALLARDLYIWIIEYLAQIADVDVVYNPSNHDWTHGFFLAQILESWFRKSKNVTFDCTIRHNKYYRYHNNLIMTSHGDGAKNKDMPIIAATEESMLWAECKRRYCYLHHLHHKKYGEVGDMKGMTVEYLRSPSGTDGWHHRNGYVGVPKAVEGFLHHPEFGQVCRITHNF